MIIDPHCKRCDGTGWVCEFHRDRPADGPRACDCGGAGAPCPVCNDPDGEQPDVRGSFDDITDVVDKPVN